MQMIFLQWLAGLAAFLLICYEIKSIALIADAGLLLWRLLKEWRVSTFGLWLQFFYSVTILVAGTGGSLLVAYCLANHAWSRVVMGELMIIASTMIIIAVLPANLKRGLRWLHEAYMEAKGVDSCK